MNFVLACLHIFAILVVASAGTTGHETRSLNSKWQEVNSEECGPIKFGHRITGGKAAHLGRYPWMARLGYEREDKTIKFKCGGSLINQKYVLTAGHCVHGWEKQLQVIRLGEHFTNTTEDCEDDICAPPVQDIGVDKLLVHPDYDRSTIKNDICLIRLAEEAEYNAFVKPICLPRDEMLTKNYITKPVEIAGWGVVNSDTHEESNTLLCVTLPIRDLCACSDAMPGLQIDNKQFCVGLETGEDSCTGDSGGPMMMMERIKETRKYYVLGIVSVGKSYCGESPAVYTNVVKYNEWILETIASTEQQYDAVTEVPEEKDN